MIIHCITLKGVEYAVLFLWQTLDLEHTKEENSRCIVEWFYSVLEEYVQIIPKMSKLLLTDTDDQVHWQRHYSS